MCTAARGAPRPSHEHELTNASDAGANALGAQNARVPSTHNARGAEVGEAGGMGAIGVLPPWPVPGPALAAGAKAPVPEPGAAASSPAVDAAALAPGDALVPLASAASDPAAGAAAPSRLRVLWGRDVPGLDVNFASLLRRGASAALIDQLRTIQHNRSMETPLTQELFAWTLRQRAFANPGRGIEIDEAAVLKMWRRVKKHVPHSEKILAGKLQQMHLKIVLTVTNGDCMFDAFIKVLGLDMSTAELRERVADYMTANISFFREAALGDHVHPLIVRADVSERETWVTWCDDWRRPRVLWGDNIIVGAIGRMFRVNVRVISSKQGDQYDRVEVCEDAGASAAAVISTRFLLR